MRKKKEVNKPFDGGFDVKAMVEALSTIEDERSISQEETLEILRQSFEKGYKDFVDPNNADDLLAEATLDLKGGKIHFFDIKNVVEDVQDDLVEIELDEAREIDPNIQIGDQLKTEVDITTLGDPSLLIRKVANTFKQKMIEANKKALLEKFNSQIGHLISGEVEKVEKGYTVLNFGKTTAVLSAKNLIPGETFKLGENVKVYLESVGEKSKNPQLMITRANNEFLVKLFEEEVHDVYDGTVIIKKVSREPGTRAKVAVYSNNPNVDPTGACIGPDGNRIRNICAQLSGEKIDVIKYIENPALFIVEALKPASVIGIRLPNDGSNTATAVVKNQESKVAIGKKGVNVRLASRLVGLSIDVKELDEAMSSKISYRTIEDIKREEALKRLSSAEASDDDIVIEPVEEHKPVVDFIPVETPVDETSTQVEETVAPETETKENESVKETVAAETEPVKEQPVEPKIAIKSKAKISLAELEAQIENEKKKGKEAPRKKFNKKNDKSEEGQVVSTKKIEPAVPTMPIYTEEELRALDEEEDEDVDSYDEYDDYDDDDYYEDDDSGKGSWNY